MGNMTRLTQALFGVIALSLFWVPSPVKAQNVVKAQHGDWQLTCDTPPGARSEQCAIIQNVAAQSQPNVSMSVVIFNTADGEATLLRVIAPLGVLLTRGLGLKIDQKDLGKVGFVRCTPGGCIAEVAMDTDLVNTFRSGLEALFIVFSTPEEGIGIPVSLKGFNDAFTALPRVATN